MLHLFTAKMPVPMVILFIMLLASTSNQYHMRLSRSGSSYELIHKVDLTADLEKTGSITLRCRDVMTAEPLPLSEVQFWLNRTRVCDPSLRNRKDINVIIVDKYEIKFNLTRRLEGNYTCGRRIENENVQESSPKTLVSRQTLIPMPEKCIIQDFTALAGERVVLPCPIQPGALLQYYSVVWTKDNDEIAINNNRYSIDRATYALTIDPVSVNDSSTKYQCHVYHQYSNTDTSTKQELQYYPQSGVGVLLSLNVISGNCIQSSKVAATATIVDSNTTMLCMCSSITATQD